VRPSLDAVRLAVNEVAPRAVVGEVLSMTEVMGASWARYRFYTVILGFFATASLVLACAGLTGTLLYDARSRRHELVVRMALGASPGRLVGGVVGRSLGMLGSGATLGLLLFWPLHRFLRGIVPGVDSTDPGALLGFVLVLAIGALVAAWAPARVIHATEPRRALG
jgi:ABC-type antimicrobial peptide transport system permease subunit